MAGSVKPYGIFSVHDDQPGKKFARFARAFERTRAFSGTHEKAHLIDDVSCYSVLLFHPDRQHIETAVFPVGRGVAFTGG
jgi:hypothetical protein